MTARDRLVVGLAVAMLVAIAGAMVVLPPPGETAVSVASPVPSPTPAPVVFTDGVVGTITTLDPLFARTRPELDVDALLFSGLTRVGPGGTVVPDLALSWTGSKDGRTWTFRLRPDAFWHDGVPVTADDVVFTVLTTQQPGYVGPLAGAWQDVTVQKLDDFDVRFRLATPVADFPLAASSPILPSHLLASLSVDRLGASAFETQPIGNGPYRLVSMDSNGAVLSRVAPAMAPAATPTPAATPAATPSMVPAAGTGRPTVAAPSPSSEPPVASSANPAASGASPNPVATAAPVTSQPGPTVAPSAAAAAPTVEGAPLDQIDIRVFPDEASLAAAFRAGTLDAAGGLSQVDVAGFATLPGVRAIRYPRAVLTAVMLNLRFGYNIVQDARVRRALLAAIDRDALVSEVLGGMGVRADTLVPPTSWAFDRTSAGHVAYDPKAAAKLLAAAGWKRTATAWIRPGTKSAVVMDLLTVDQATNPIDYAIASRVAAYWKAIGIRVRMTVLSGEALVSQALIPGKFGTAVVDLNLGLDADLYPLLASAQAVQGGTNLSGYQSAALDKLLEAARSYASRATRAKRVAAVEKQLATELPVLPLVYADYVYVVRDTLQGPASMLISDPGERYWDVLTWRLAKPAGR